MENTPADEIKRIIDALNTPAYEIKRIIEGVISFGETVSDYVASFEQFRERFPALLADIHEAIKTFQDHYKRFPIIMVELGWPPMDLYFDEARAIIDSYDRDDVEAVRGEVEKFLLAKFDSEEIGQIVSSWAKAGWSTKRMPILQQAINSHHEGKFYVSVPAFLTQLEGVIADHFGHRGRMRQSNLAKCYNALLSCKDKLSFDDAVKKFLFEIVLVDFEHGCPLKSSLSRHAILHGADTDYGTAVNSLKAILLFDYIQVKVRTGTVKA